MDCSSVSVASQSRTSTCSVSVLCTRTHTDATHSAYEHADQLPLHVGTQIEEINPEMGSLCFKRLLREKNDCVLNIKVGSKESQIKSVPNKVIESTQILLFTTEGFSRLSEQERPYVMT